jgi:hypothetical protein
MDTNTNRVYYSLDRSLVTGNGEDIPFQTLLTAYDLYWTLDGVRDATRAWTKRGWVCIIEGPHELPAGCDTTNIHR